MSLIPEWAPNIHPMLVHFPIGIILLAVLFEFLNFVVPGRWWDEIKTTLLYGAGAISAVVVYYTGTVAADTVFLPADAQSILNEHADWAWWTAWFFSLYLVMRVIFHRYRLFQKKGVRIAVFLLVFPGVFMLYETGDHGAEMVFGYGVGTGGLLEQQEQDASAGDSLITEVSSRFKVRENGNWSWAVGPDGVEILLSRFTWLEGTVQDLQPSVARDGDNYLLRLAAGTLTNFFVTEQAYRNVQVDYHLDISNFEGDVFLVNHVQDAQNYDFVRLSSDGTVAQGRMSEGSRRIFAEKPYDFSGMMFVRTVGHDTHFRAYIDRETVVHGHGEVPQAGSVGLRFEGSGSILIDSISMTRLN